MLAALGLAGHRDAGGQVGDAHRAFGLVDMLATGAGGAIDIDPHVLFGNVDLDRLVDHRIDRHRWKRGVAAGVGIEGRNPHQAVNPGLAFQPAIGIVAIDPDGGGFQPRALAFAFLDQLQLVAMLFGPACVHAKQHRGPVLAFGAARAGMDFDIGVIAVGFARQHGLQPLFFGARRQGGDLLLGVGHQSGVAFGFRHLDHAGGVGEFIFQRAHGAERRVQLLAFAHQFLRGLGIVPEGGVFGLGVQFIQPAEGFVPVKDASSAGRWPARCRRPGVGFRGA